MIPRKLDTVQLADLQALIDNAVSEGKRIEYKEALPGQGNGDRGKFLAGIVAFANDSGGDFILGIAESKGVPVSIIGIDSEDPDADILQIQQMFLHNIEPRISPPEIQPIRVADEKYVYVIRVARSLNGPHRFKGNGHFYARTSNGKYPMDINEIRNSFLQASTLRERIRNIRHVRARQFEAPSALPGYDLQTGPKLLVHAVPMNWALDENLVLPKKHIPAGSKLFPNAGSYRSAILVDGLLYFARTADGLVDVYTKVDTSGIVETVFVYDRFEAPEQRIRGPYTEHLIIDLAERARLFFAEVEIPLPFAYLVSLIGATGYSINLGRSYRLDTTKFDRGAIYFPDVVIDDPEINVDAAVRPILDSFWNAFGQRECLNFDESGKWVAPDVR